MKARGYHGGKEMRGNDESKDWGSEEWRRKCTEQEPDSPNIGAGDMTEFIRSSRRRVSEACLYYVIYMPCVAICRNNPLSSLSLHLTTPPSSSLLLFSTDYSQPRTSSWLLRR